MQISCRGAIEWLTPDNHADHWDLIEGQGSLFHASYAGVTLGLIHGAQPDALVLCHEPKRPHIRHIPTQPMPGLEELERRAVEAAQLTNPEVQVVGISANTSGLEAAAARTWLDQAEDLARRACNRPRPGTRPRLRAHGNRTHRGPGHCDLMNQSPVSVCSERWELAKPFVISRGARTHAEIVVAEVDLGEAKGRGECVPYAHYGETLDGVIAQARAVLVELLQDVSGGIQEQAGELRRALQQQLEPGAARNAADCALWDLEAKLSGQRVHELLGQPAPSPLLCAYTLSLGSPESMYEAAYEHRKNPLLKLKCDGAGDLPRLRAVRRGAPDARLIIDANESWTPEIYTDLLAPLAELGVEMIEQPFPRGDDSALASLKRPIAVCADESCHDRNTLAGLEDRYDLINIKLDKTGGLTEALALRDAAEALGLGIMVGCMVGTSLAMAPALEVARGARYVDLDGPLLLKEDRSCGLDYTNHHVHPAAPELWG